MEELLLVPPVGFRPRCAMVVVPPGISNGTSRSRECSGKALRVPVQENTVHPLCVALVIFELGAKLSGVISRFHD